MQSFTQSLALSLPEAILAVGALVLLLIGAFRGDRSLGLLSWLCVGLYAAAGLALLGPEGVGYDGLYVAAGFSTFRSEERRVGEECVSPCRSRWSPDHYKKNNKNK